MYRPSTRTKTVVLALILVAALPLVAMAGEIEDGESKSHSADAARIVVVDTYDFPDFKVIQFDLAVLSQYSYFLVSEGEALLVDPVRDIQTYLDLAQKEGFKIKGTLLTHSHADFVAGHSEVARAIGVPIYISARAGVGYKHVGLTEKSVIKVGKATVKFIATPGHTPESMCALVYGEETTKQPAMMFSGDTLFVGSVGRPDLMGGTASAAWLASQMFDSWTGKLKDLGDNVKFFPAHGAGSLCGAHLSDEPYSTIGEQKVSNVYLQHKTRSAFIAAVLDGLPNAPQYFSHNAAMNKKGPALVDWKAQPPVLTASRELMNHEKTCVIDLREAKEFAEGHIPGSVNIALRGRLETWTGMMVPWGKAIVLTGGDKEMQEASRRLHRIGYTVAGTLPYKNWKASGLPVKTNRRIAPKDLYGLMKKGKEPIIVDVRLPKEWMGLKIGQVVNLPLNELDRLSAKLDPKEPVVAVCNSAFRSSLALGILERKGFRDVLSLDGGGEAWIKAGLPTIKGVKQGGGDGTSYRTIRLPERIDPAQLKRLLMDLPETVEVVDLRPPAHFKDYHVPGSANAHVAEVIDGKAYVAGKVPLVLVSRDGTIAMAVGGILSQKTERPIKVLYGGIEAYWEKTTLPVPGMLGGGKPGLTPTTRPAAQPAKPKVAPKPASKRRRRSAGC